MEESQEQFVERVSLVKVVSYIGRGDYDGLAAFAKQFLDGEYVDQAINSEDEQEWADFVEKLASAMEGDE